MPDNLPIHAEFRQDTLGNDFTVNDQVQRDISGLISHKPLPKNFTVTGIQGQLWSETIRSDNQAEYMLYPRLLALAERAWHQASWQVPYNNQGAIYNKSSTVFTERLRQTRDQQWLSFSHAIGAKELPKLDLAKVFYRIPTVGAHIDSSQLAASLAIKGLPIEYRYVNEQGNGQWQAYEAPGQVSQPVQIRARSANNKRAGRALFINKEVE
jgi:hexosaminidase